MKKFPFVFCLLLAINSNLYAQEVEIKIVSNGNLKGKRAILLTREKGFASIVHSVKIMSDMVTLQLARDLVPDLYQLNIAQMKGSLYFFLEPGIQITVDTTDVAKSKVTNSKSNPDWKRFYESVQRPSDLLVNSFTAGETRARKSNSTDSLKYWMERKITENRDFLDKTSAFITEHPYSYVSLYLLKNNWYAFKDKNMFERLDVSMAGHRSYKLLKEKNREASKITGR